MEGPGALTAKKRRNKDKGKGKNKGNEQRPEGAAVAATDDELSKIDGINSFMGNSAQNFNPDHVPIDAELKKIAENAAINKSAANLDNSKSRIPSIDIEGADPNAATANNGNLPVIPPIGS